MKKQVIIGTRSSRLAQIQSQEILARLDGICTGISFTLKTIVTIGDRQKTTPVASIPSYGAFVKDLQDALLNGKVDIAVHSLKDLPVGDVPGLTLAAITERLEPGDVLVSRAGKLNEIPAGSTIGTGSPRRAAQLLAYQPDLKVQGMRGNIDTRIAKLDKGEVAGIVVAAAGLIRLGWKNKITEYLPVEHFLPEAGQGALAIEIRTCDKAMLDIVTPLNHKATAKCVAAERALVKAMCGGCSVPFGALGTLTGNSIKLQGMAFHAGKPIYATLEGDASQPEIIAGRLAQKLVAMGAIR